MNKIVQLKEIKGLRSRLVDVANVYSKDMDKFIFNLYKHAPAPSYNLDINEDDLKTITTTDFMLKILKKMCNPEISKEYVAYTKKYGLDREQLHTYRELLSRMSFLGRQIDYSVYGDSNFNKKYLPDLDQSMYELLSVLYYANMHPIEGLRNKLIVDRFNYISEYIWNAHIIDEASKGFLFPNYEKLASKIKEEGYDTQLKIVYDVKNKYNNINIYDLNSYIVANILVSEFFKDTYAFNSMLQELHTTDNMNYEEVLSNLGINYIQQNDIIKSLRIAKEDNHGITK